MMKYDEKDESGVSSCPSTRDSESCSSSQTHLRPPFATLASKVRESFSRPSLVTLSGPAFVIFFLATRRLVWPPFCGLLDASPLIDENNCCS